MKDVFAWQVIAETETDEIKFPRRISERKISDSEIKCFLELLCDVHDVDIPVNFIFNLTFIANDLNGAHYAESLSPFDFWPIPANELHPENRSIFRQDSKTKKGGEK